MSPGNRAVDHIMAELRHQENIAFINKEFVDLDVSKMSYVDLSGLIERMRENNVALSGKESHGLVLIDDSEFNELCQRAFHSFELYFLSITTNVADILSNMNGFTRFLHKPFYKRYLKREYAKRNEINEISNKSRAQHKKTLKLVVHEDELKILNDWISLANSLQESTTYRG